MKILKVVGALMIKDDFVYAFKRNHQKSFPGKWEFPGGKIEKNESPQKALKRELKEELDLDLKIGNSLGKNIFSPYTNFVIEIEVFIVKTSQDYFKLNVHKNFQKVNRNNFYKLDWIEGDICFLEKYFNIKK